MDRIESLEAFQFSKPSERRKAGRGRSSKAARFSSALDRAHAENRQYDPADYADGTLSLSLEELLDEVHGSGEVLIETQSLESVKRYRQAVRSFLDYVVKAMLKVEETTSGGSVARRKRFTQIRIIDEKLERLVSGVLQNQKRQLDLLEGINEIQGLLVDLMS